MASLVLCEDILDKRRPTVTMFGEGADASSFGTNVAAQEQFPLHLTFGGGEPGEGLLPMAAISLPSNLGLLFPSLRTMMIHRTQKVCAKSDADAAVQNQLVKDPVSEKSPAESQLSSAKFNVVNAPRV